MEVEWEEEEEEKEAGRGNLCGPAGVLGGVSMAEMLSTGGREKTTGREESDPLLISTTWMGPDWLLRITWCFF